MSWPKVIERLERGEKVQIRPTGTSMTPRIRPKQLVTLERWPPPKLGRSNVPTHLEPGLVVLAKVRGRFYLHKISRCVGEYPYWDRIEISNNHGHVNGWTTRDKVYAVVTKVE